MRSSSLLLNNTFYAIGTSLTGKIVNVVTFILIGRFIGTKDAGIFSLATTYLLIFSAITWGLDELMIRQIARYRSEASQYFSSFLVLRLIIAIILYCTLFFILTFLIRYEVSTLIPILIFSLSLIPDSLGYVGNGLLIAFEEFKPQFVITFLMSFIKFIGVVAAFFMLTDLLSGLGWFWFITSCVGATATIYIATRYTGRIDIKNSVNWQFWARNIKIALPFLLISFLITLEYQTDVVILSITQGESEVGIYGAATTVIFALTLLPQAYRAAVYPIMTRYHISDPAKLKQLYRSSFFFLGTAVLPIVVGTTILSKQIVYLIFGLSFEDTIVVLQVISWVLIFLYLNVPNSRMMLVNDQQQFLVLLLTGTLIFNIIMNLILDPYLGALGAAFARVISAFVFFVINYIFIVRNFIQINIIPELTKPIIAVTIMAGAVWLVRDQHILIPIFVGISTYFLSLIAIHGIPKYEGEILLETLRQIPIKYK